jgi:hypothetical protein
VGDHHAIGVVEGEQPAHELDQVGEIVVGQGVCAQPPERDLTRVGDGGELRGDPLDERTGLEADPGVEKAARSGRSAPTESIVPPVVTIATRARVASGTFRP